MNTILKTTTPPKLEGLARGRSVSELDQAEVKTYSTHQSVGGTYLWIYDFTVVTLYNTKLPSLLI